MEPAAQIPRPSLIVITGRPGSGKTTLAHQLAKQIRCPAICRDEIKEGFVNTTGQMGELGGKINKEIYEVFFDTLKLLLSHQVSLIAEAAFQHHVWEPRLQTLRHLANIRIILCNITPELARSRHIQRGLADPLREKFHNDQDVQAAREGHQLPIAPYDPPHMDLPMLSVDTTDNYQPDLDSIVSFACARESGIGLLGRRIMTDADPHTPLG